jgi:hypothetical protein
MTMFLASYHYMIERYKIVITLCVYGGLFVIEILMRILTKSTILIDYVVEAEEEEQEEEEEKKEEEEEK